MQNRLQPLARLADVRFDEQRRALEMSQVKQSAFFECCAAGGGDADNNSDGRRVYSFYLMRTSANIRR